MADNNIRLAVFCCENSAYVLAHAITNQLPAGVEIIKMPCGGRVEHVHLLQALKSADGVLTLTCLADNCKHFRGNARAEKRTGYVQEMVSKIGLSKDRVAYGEVAANDAQKFFELVNDFYDQLKEMGPIEGKVN